MTTNKNTHDKVHVTAYERNDGTDVREHYRSYPGGEPMTQEEKRMNERIVKYGKYLDIAHANYLNARTGLAFAKNDPNATVYESRARIGFEPIKNFLDKLGVSQNARAVFYHCDSDYSEKLAKNKQIVNYINNNYLYLKSGALQKSSHSIEFPMTNLDEYAGIQKMTMFDMHIDTSGYFNAFVVDYYDFNKRYKKNVKNIEEAIKKPLKDAAVDLNNFGYALQEKGLLENYVNIYYIRTNKY